MREVTRNLLGFSGAGTPVDLVATGAGTSTFGAIVTGVGFGIVCGSTSGTKRINQMIESENKRKTRKKIIRQRNKQRVELAFSHETLGFSTR